MIKSVNNYPVSQLFDIEAGVVYAIPRYQREYWQRLRVGAWRRSIRGRPHWWTRW
jgi:hypothetical protein